MMKLLLTLTASETFDVDADLGSTVFLDYEDRRPFEFTGTIDSVRVGLNTARR